MTGCVLSNRWCSLDPYFCPVGPELRRPLRRALFSYIRRHYSHAVRILRTTNPPRLGIPARPVLCPLRSRLLGRPSARTGCFLLATYRCEGTRGREGSRPVF